jgi:hypothetical protein
MATGKLLQALRSGLVTSAGVVVASGKVRFYDPGTLTPKAVYSDSAVSTTITQPLTLTAGGTGTVYVTGPVRMIAKDALDSTTLYDDVIASGVDGDTYVVSPSFNAGAETLLSTILDAVDDSFGGTDWQYKQAAAATPRTLKAWMGEVHISVKDYGALGDDANDDTAEIQAAIDAAAAAGASVYFPPGTYRITSAITMPSSSLTIRGIQWASIIKNMSTTGHAFSGGTDDATFQFIGLRVTANTQTTGYAFSFTAGQLILESVKVDLHRRCASSSGSNETPALVVANSLLTATNEATGACVVSDYMTMIRGSALASAHASSTAVTLSGNVGSIVSACIFTLGSGVGIHLSGTTTSATAVISGNVFSSGNRILIAAGVGAVSDSGNIGGTMVDARTGSPVRFSVSTTSTVNPLAALSSSTLITATVAGITVTVGSPGDHIGGTVHTVFCKNASGGAVTWAFGAAWTLTSAGVPTPATGNQTAIIFVHTNGEQWREVTRGSTVT